MGENRVVVMAASIIIMLAVIGAVGLCIYVNQPKEKEGGPKQSPASMRAVKTMCAITDYKTTCYEYICPDAGDNTDLQELLTVAFNITMTNITEAATKSEMLGQTQEDPRTKHALLDCKELMDSAYEEFQKSFDHLGDIDITQADEIAVDMRMWLSAVYTYQETCLDGLKNTSGDAQERMRYTLGPARKMTINCLSIVDRLPEVYKAMKKAEAVGALLGDRIADAGVEGAEDEKKKGKEGYPDDEGLVDDTEGKEAKKGEKEKSRRRRRLMSEEWDDEAGMRRLLGDKDDKDESPFKKKPKFVVAKDGSGNYGHLSEALENIELDNDKPVVIRIKEGIYKEVVEIKTSMTNVVLIGDGANKTRFTGNQNFMFRPVYGTASFAVKGDYFMAKNIGFENTAGPENQQAVALRVQADKSIFYNCSIEGFEGTLHTHANRQFFRDCNISGTVDFVFGDAAANFQNCIFQVRKPLKDQKCTVTAQARKKECQPTGLIIQNSTFVADKEYFPVRKEQKSYLGRPRKKNSRTIVMTSYMDDLIAPEGWSPWQKDDGLETCFFAEVDNKGPGAEKGKRVKWKGIRNIGKDEMEESFVPEKFIQGDKWIKKSGVPYVSDYGGDKDYKKSNASAFGKPKESKKSDSKSKDSDSKSKD